MCLRAEPQAESDLRVGSRCYTGLQPRGASSVRGRSRTGASQRPHPPTHRADKSTAAAGGGEAASAGAPQYTSVGNSKLRTDKLDTF